MESPSGGAANSSRDEAPVVFISHSSVDRDVAVAICRALEDAGVRCWMAPRDILEGVEWDEAITDGVERAFLVVLVLSRQSNASPEVAREVRGAVTRKLPILPFCVEDVPPSKALDYALSTAHRFAAYEPPLDDHLRRLVGVVREHVAAKGVPLSSPAAIPWPALPRPIRRSERAAVRRGGLRAAQSRPARRHRPFRTVLAGSAESGPGPLLPALRPGEAQRGPDHRRSARGSSRSRGRRRTGSMPRCSRRFSSTTRAP